MIDSGTINIIPKKFFENDHEWIFVSTKQKKDFIQSILNLKTINALTKAQKQYISTCIDNALEYREDKNALYYVRHMKLEFFGPLCFMIPFKQNCPAWWRALNLQIKTSRETVPFYFYSICEENTTRLFEQEVLAEDFMHVINFALNIEGWDYRKTPFVFLVLIDEHEEIPQPRLRNVSVPFIANRQTQGRGCEIQVKTQDGKIMQASVVDGGKGYVVNDVLELISTNGWKGSAIVRQAKDGKILNVAVTQPGEDYEDDEIVLTYHSTHRIPRQYSVNTHADLLDVEINIVNRS